MSLPLERRAVWMQMEMQRRALAYVKWSLDQSGINRWRRRYQRMGLGWDDYLAEFEAEYTTRHQEDDQGDFINGPRKWSLTAQIDPPYKIFHIPHYGKKDIDDPDNALVVKVRRMEVTTKMTWTALKKAPTFQKIVNLMRMIYHHRQNRS